MYPIAVAMLDISRVYSGYENANFVLEEVRRPPGNETKVFRYGAKGAIMVVWFFYLMVNIPLVSPNMTRQPQVIIEGGSSL